MKKHMILMLAVIALVACSPKNEKSSGSPVGDTRELVQKPELTKEQSEEIKGIMQKASLMPDAELLLGPEKTTEDSEKRRAEEVQKLSSESKQIFEKLSAECEIEKPEAKKTNDGQKPVLKETIKREASIAGTKCAISYKETSSAVSNLTESESESSIDGSDTSTAAMKVVGQDLQNQVGYTEMTRSSSGSSHSQFKGNKMVEHSSKGLTIETIVINSKSKLKIRSLVEIQLKEDKMDSYLRIDLDFPSSSPTVQVFKKIDDKESTYYLNGQKVERQQVIDLFGPRFGTITIDGKELSNKVTKVEAKTGP